jgi:hypothetical protein
MEARAIAAHDRLEAGIAEADVEEAARAATGPAPKILVATEPTELIVSDGPPKWTGLVGEELQTLGNSESDVFMTPSDRSVWLVLSGRWYRSASLEGPWQFVEATELPAVFRSIPAESPKASVLAFVPGTAPAREALRDATTPRTAAIKRSQAHVQVTYDGEPKFESVPGTHVEYALNTAEQVLRIRGRYFACDQGVWFTGKTPDGPWVVADEVPDDEIQGIPPESPVYNTRFVTVYDSTPDEVFVAYTPAYLGSYAWGGTVVYGTGWAYRPWWGAFYYPRPWTWGFHPFYRPWVGWGWGGWGYWGGLRYGVGLGWGARWCGPGGFYRPAMAVNINRNVTVNRNVNVTRNVYTQGANAARATTPQSAAKAAPTKQPATQASKGSKGQKGSAGKTTAAKPNAKGSKAGGAKPSAKAGGGKKGH